MKYVETLGGKTFQVDSPKGMIYFGSVDIDPVMIANFRKQFADAIAGSKWSSPKFTMPVPPPPKNDPDVLDAIRYMTCASRGAGKTHWANMYSDFKMNYKEGTISKLESDGHSGCKHDMRLYDSGWTREMYCTKCSHREKA